MARIASVKTRVILRNLSNVAASKTALLEVPIGARFHGIFLEHGYSAGTNTVAAAATNISEIRIKVNGNVVRVYSGTQLRDLLLRNGTTYDCLGVPNTAPGVSFALWFAEPWRKDPDEGDALAWATALWSSFQVEIDLGAASTPTLVASAIVDAIAADGNEAIVKVIRSSVNAAGTSFDIPTIDRKGYLQSLALYQDSGGSNTASKVTLKVNTNTIVYEATASANKAQISGYGFTPTASGRTSGITDLIMDVDDLIGSALLLAQYKDMSLTVEAASTMSGTITYLLQRLEGLNG
jgi:hypothetical protein